MTYPVGERCVNEPVYNHLCESSRAEVGLHNGFVQIHVQYLPVRWIFLRVKDEPEDME